MTASWLMTARLPPEDMARAAIEGDQAAVDALAKAWLPHVYRWCHRLGGPGFDAEDAAHEVLILMCRRIHTLRDPAVFPSWLMGITRRVLANHRRRAWWKRWVPTPPKSREPVGTSDPEQDLATKRAQERVWNALSQLGQNHREVLVMCLLEERSATETAALLGIPVGTVKSRLRAARVSFRRALEEDDRELPAPPATAAGRR